MKSKIVPLPVDKNRFGHQNKTYLALANLMNAAAGVKN